MRTVISVMEQAQVAASRVILRVYGQRVLRAAAAVLRQLHRSTGDRFYGDLAAYLDKTVLRHAPPVELRRRLTVDGQVNALPTGDRT